MSVTRGQFDSWFDPWTHGMTLKSDNPWTRVGPGGCDLKLARSVLSHNLFISIDFYNILQFFTYIMFLDIIYLVFLNI